jgi:hypothetical protein
MSTDLCADKSFFLVINLQCLVIMLCVYFATLRARFAHEGAVVAEGSRGLRGPSERCVA